MNDVRNDAEEPESTYGLAALLQKISADWPPDERQYFAGNIADALDLITDEIEERASQRAQQRFSLRKIQKPEEEEPYASRACRAAESLMRSMVVLRDYASDDSHMQEMMDALFDYLGFEPTVVLLNGAEITPESVDALRTPPPFDEVYEPAYDPEASDDEMPPGWTEAEAEEFAPLIGAIIDQLSEVAALDAEERTLAMRLVTEQLGRCMQYIADREDNDFARLQLVTSLHRATQIIPALSVPFERMQRDSLILKAEEAMDTSDRIWLENQSAMFHLSAPSDGDVMRDDIAASVRDDVQTALSDDDEAVEDQ